jgi:serine/threonine protein kinase
MGDRVDARFQVDELLGAGGAGVTYRCTELSTGIAVALKVLHHDRRRGVLANRLAIEGELLELFEHAHIVPFHGLNLVADGPVWLATRYMGGGSLDAWLRRHGALRPAGAVEAGRQLALALDYVHAAGVVHRDLKPGNVLLETADEVSPRIRLADFGIARLFRSVRPLPGLTRTGAFIGTPEYSAPEQLRGDKGIGPAADAFALGALLHFAAGGKPLHRREEISDWESFRTRRWLPGERQRLVDIRGAAATGVERDALALLDEVIDALMHPDPRERLDLATAALRLGAAPRELTPCNPAAAAARTLLSEAEGLEATPELGFPGDARDARTSGARDAAPGADVEPLPEALLPETAGAEPEDLDAEPATEAAPVGPAAAEPAAAESLPGPAPDAGPSPQAECDPEPTAFDWPWPHRETRRERVHGAFAVAAALLLGVAAAWPSAVSRDAGYLAAAPAPSSWSSLGSAPFPRSAAQPARAPGGNAAAIAQRAVPRKVAAKSAATPAAPPASTRPVKPETRVASKPVVAPTHAPVFARVTVGATVPKREPAPLTPVESWARDASDTRSIDEVVDAEVDREEQRYFEDLRAQNERADARAARYEAEAAEQDARRRELVANLARLQETLRRHAADGEAGGGGSQGARSKESNGASAGTADGVEFDGGVPLLLELFGRTPRVDPLADAERP